MNSNNNTRWCCDGEGDVVVLLQQQSCRPSSGLAREGGRAPK